MRFWFGKKFRGCKWEDSCDCHSLDPGERRCEDCQSYRATDGGYGRCRATPAWALVPWCRDVCGLFGSRPDHCLSCHGTGEVLGPPTSANGPRWPRPCPDCGGRKA